MHEFDGFCDEKGPLMVEAINWLHDNDINELFSRFVKKA